MPAVIINPNSTEAMTDAMLEVAQTAAPEIRFEGRTSHKAPAAIQGPEDGAAAEAYLLDLVREAETQNAEGIIIGCFDDTALAQAAKIASCPVVGLGQASYHYAAMRNWRFSVVTTLAVSVPILEQNIHALGLAGSLSKVRASDVPVLALHEDPEAATQRVLAEASNAAQHDNIDAIIFGCAGMVDITKIARQKLATHVIDPVVVSAKSLNWLL